MAATAEAFPGSPFPDAPAPWKCQGEVFWFLDYTSGSTAAKGLPAEAFGPLERETYSDKNKSGAFVGGPGAVMLVRYTSSPAGPYDELMLIPGKHEVPPTGQKKLRITRIYVSTKESVYNGRKNWNIPKVQAQFTFHPIEGASPTALQYSRVEVALPDDPEHPFFVANMAPTMMLSAGSIPYSTRWTPLDMELIMPPVGHSEDWKTTGQVGTERWWSVTPIVAGKVGFFSSTGGVNAEGDYGDGKGFPKVKPFGLGMWLSDMHLDFPVGHEVTDKKNT